MLIDVASSIVLTAGILLPLVVPASALGADVPLTSREHWSTVAARLLVAAGLGVLLIACAWPLAAAGLMFLWIGVEREIHVRRRHRRLAHRGLGTP
jgi:hypothetical protein